MVAETLGNRTPVLHPKGDPITVADLPPEALRRWTPEPTTPVQSIDAIKLLIAVAFPIK